MAEKSIIAAGLDVGSAKTRLVVCVLEQGTAASDWVRGVVDARLVKRPDLRPGRGHQVHPGGALGGRGDGRHGGGVGRGGHGRTHRARRQQPRRAGVGLSARDRTTRYQSRGGPRYARSVAGRPHAAAGVPAGFCGGRSSWPPQPAGDEGHAPGKQRPPADRHRCRNTPRL